MGESLGVGLDGWSPHGLYVKVIREAPSVVTKPLRMGNS